MKGVLSIGLCVVMVMVFVGCSKQPSDAKESKGMELETINLRVGTVTSASSNYVKGLEVMKSAIEKNSGGKITMEIFPDSQLGGERDMIEGVSLGTLEMCITSSAPIANFSSDFLVFDLPYLITNRTKAYAVMDGPIGRQILDTLNAKNIYAFSFWENGFRNITNNHREIVHPADIKGMKIRTMENEIQQATFLTLGAYPTPMAWAEVFAALEQGVIDAQENPLVAIVSTRIYEIQKYITMTGHVYTPSVLMINAKLFNGLSDQARKIILDGEDAAKVWERSYSKDLDVTLRRQLEAEGVIFTDVNMQEWRDAVQSVYKKYEGKINPEYINAFSN